MSILSAKLTGPLVYYGIPLNVQIQSQPKKLYIYILLDHVYCTVPLRLWRPHQVQHVMLLERVQHRASKFILYSIDYKSRLIKLNLLPLMYIYELTDILFSIKSITTSNNSFDIIELISFSSSNIRSLGTKLCHRVSINNITLNSYFFRLWNSFPIIDISLPYDTIKRKLISFLWSHFLSNFDSNNNCTLHFLCPCCRCAKLPHTLNCNWLLTTYCL